MHITPRCRKHDVNLVGEIYKDELGLVAYYAEGNEGDKGFDVDLSYHWCPVYGKMVNDAANREDWVEETRLEDEEDCRNDWYMIVTGDKLWELVINDDGAEEERWEVIQRKEPNEV